MRASVLAESISLLDLGVPASSEPVPPAPPGSSFGSLCSKGTSLKCQYNNPSKSSVSPSEGEM